MSPSLKNKRVTELGAADRRLPGWSFFNHQLLASQRA